MITVLVLLSIGTCYGINTASPDHFVPIYTGNPYLPMTIVVSNATIDGIDMVAGDEIGIFDVNSDGDTICVGYGVLTGPIGTPFFITASTDDPTTTIQDGFIESHTIIYSLWDASAGIEIWSPAVSYNTTAGVDVFTSFGTAYITITGLSYQLFAVAGGPYEEVADQSGFASVTLDGSASVSLDNTIVDWDWQWSGGSSTGETTTVDFAEGTTNVTLTVTDGDGNTATDQATVVIYPYGTHFIPDYLPSNPYQPMSIIVTVGNLGDNIGLEAGDEIAIFDTDAGGNEFCVGAFHLNAPITNALIITASADDPTTSELDGFVTGNEIIYRIWDASEGAEITQYEVNYYTGDEVFTPLGTSVIQLYGYPIIETNAPGMTNCQFDNIIVPITVELLYGVTDFDIELMYDNTLFGFSSFQNENTAMSSGTFDVTSASGIINITWEWDGVTSLDILTGTLVELVLTPLQSGTGNLEWQEANSSYTNSFGNTINATYSDGSIEFSFPPIAAAGADEEICLNTPSYYLADATAANQSAILWTTSGDGTFDNATIQNPTYTPGAADIAAFSVTLSITASATTPCTVDSTDSMVLTFALLPTADAGADADICEDNSHQLAGTATYFSSTLWTTSGDGTFDDATSLTAIYTPGATDIVNGSVDLVLFSYASLPCTDDASDTLTITIGLLPIANAGADEEICLNTQSYYLANATAANQSAILWTTSGDGTFDDATIQNPTYTPGAADIAAFSVTLSITASATTPCTVNSTDSMELTFALLPTADAGADADICEDNSHQLAGTATYFSSTLWTTSGDGIFDDATSLTAIYTPGANDIINGSVDLVLFSYASLPCTDDASDTMTITIGLLPIANAGDDEEICLSTQSYYLANATAANQSAISWTTSGDGTFDDVTIQNPTYTPGAADIAAFSVTLSITASATTPCTAGSTDSMLLTFAFLPIADAGADADLCETESYTLSGSYDNGSSCLWTTAGDGTFNDATLPNAIYTPGSTDISNGTVDLTITSFAQFPCTDDASDMMTLTLILLPEVNAGMDDGICATTDFFTTDGSASGGFSSTLWTTSGDGTFDDASMAVTNYNPGPSDIANEGVSLTLTAYPTAPCANSVLDDMFLLIQPMPTSNAGSNGEVCEGDGFMLSGSGTNYDHVYWATAGDGTFNDPFLTNATYTPGPEDGLAGSVVLTMFAYSVSPCYGEVGDDMTLTVFGLPTVDAGEDGETCESTPYTLDGSAENYGSVIWSTAGDGTFDDPSSLSASYLPGPDDIAAGMVDLTLTATPSSPSCSGNVTDMMTLTIMGMPGQPDTPDGPTLILPYIPNTDYTTNEVENATSYNWYMEPAAAGTIEGNGTVGTVYWNAEFDYGFVNIYVESVNDCGITSSEILEVWVDGYIGVNQANIEPKVTIAPNPSNGKFNVVVEGLNENAHLMIMNAKGQVIHQQEIINTLRKTTHSIDISSVSNGSYYMRIFNNNRIIIKKVILLNQ